MSLDHWYIYLALIVSLLFSLGFIAFVHIKAEEAIKLRFRSATRNSDEIRNRAENALRIAEFFSIVITIGLFITGSGALALGEDSVAAMFTAMGSGLACLLMGAIGGFLFGVPRVIQAAPNTRTGPHQESDPAPKVASPRDYTQQVNSNLEEISDWLTKIIVGVGLVEARKILAFVDITATKLSAGFGNQGFGYALMWSVLLFFPAAGFLGSYLLTRLFLAEAFGLADRAADSVPITSGSGGDLLDNTELDPTKQLAADPATKEAAERMAEQVDIDQLETPEDFGRWAKAQILSGNLEEAVDALGNAVELFPDNLSLRLDYAAALFKANDDMPSAPQLDELRTAYRRLSGSTPLRDVRRVYKGLTYALLYSKDGFDDAIAYGEEYFARQNRLPSKGILLNLVCAYGQKVRSLQSTLNQDPTMATRIQKMTDNAYQTMLRLKAVSEEQGKWVDDWKGEVRLRLDPNDPAKVANPKLRSENDLEVFADDPRFAALVGPLATPSK